MEDSAGLVSVGALGIGSQLVANRLRIPAILLLLASGVVAGPVLGLVEPDELLGELLFPVVSLGVAVVLFEGGLGLRLAELREQRSVILRLVSIGVVVTWGAGTAVALLVLDVPDDVAVLVAAVLVVSGPTVVLPLLREVEPREPGASVLRWEGILIDPVGAILAIAVLEAIVEQDDVGTAAVRMATTFAAGSVVGVAAAALLAVALARHWVPDQLHNPVTLVTLLAGFEAANAVRPEAGLMAATVAGVALANQRHAAVAHITEFGESLGLLVVSSLFVLLAARIDLDEVVEFLPASLAILAVLVLVARPLGVLLSTAGSSLAWPDRAFIAWMAPRGIVAASVSSLFALRLEQEGIDAGTIVPVTFTVIAGTVVLYGLTARPVAKLLHVARLDPGGVAVVGGEPWVRQVAESLVELEVPVLLITSDDQQAAAAAEAGVLAYKGSLDAEELEDVLQLVRPSVALGLSRSEEINARALARLSQPVGRANLYLLPLEESARADGGKGVSFVARTPFDRSASHQTIDRLLEEGARVAVVPAEELDRERELPLLAVDGGGRVRVLERSSTQPGDGEQVVALRSPG